MFNDIRIYLERMIEAFKIIDPLGYDNGESVLSDPDAFAEDYVFNVSEVIIDTINKLFGVKAENAEIFEAIRDGKTVDELIVLAIELKVKEEKEANA